MNRGQSQQQRSTGAMAQTRLMWQLAEDKKRKEDKNNPESIVANESGKTENPGALISDSPGAGGMSKASFLQELDQNIRTTADPLLAKAGRSSANCPWINFVMQFYQSHSSEALLKAIHDFIPGSIYAQSPADLMAMITERTQSSVATWVETGQITGLPNDVQARLPKHLQAESKENEAEKANKQLNEGGQALEGTIKSLMESALGANLSEVKIHTGSEAGVLTGQHKAKALTVGQNIAFNTGEYKPGTPEGDALLAHELAHTVQQKDAEKETEKAEEPTNEEGFENEANEVAEEAVTGIWAKTKKLGKKIGKGLRGGLSINKCAYDHTEELKKLRDKSKNKPEAAEKPEIASAAVIVGSNAIQMESFENYQEKNWRFFFSKNPSLSGKASKPDAISDWDSYEKKSSKQKMILLDIAGIKAENDNPKRNSENLDLIKTALSKWPNDYFAILQSSESEDTNSCNLFVGETLYEAGYTNFSKNGKFYSAGSIYKTAADDKMENIEKPFVAPGDVAAWNGTHVGIVVSVDQQSASFITREGYHIGNMGQENSGGNRNILDDEPHILRVK